MTRQYAVSLFLFDDSLIKDHSSPSPVHAPFITIGLFIGSIFGNDIIFFGARCALDRAPSLCLHGREKVMISAMPIELS